MQRTPKFFTNPFECYNPPSQVSATQTADGCCVSGMDGQRACQSEYLDQLCMGNPLSGSLTDGLLLVDSDSSNDKTLPSLNLFGEAVARLRGGTASGVCNFIVELI